MIRTMYFLIVFSYKKKVSIPQSHFNCALLIKTMEEPCNEWRRTVDVTEREGEFKETEREGVRSRKREKGKSVEKSRGKYREGGPLLTKDGVKMEGEKYGKGEPHATRLYLSLFLSYFLSHFLLGVPVGIRLPKCAGRFRNFAGGIPRAMRQLFKTISISISRRGILVI